MMMLGDKIGIEDAPCIMEKENDDQKSGVDLEML